MADFELTGVREMVARLNAKPGQVRDACGEGLNRFGEKIMREARDRYTPKKWGNLRRSGRVDKPEFQRDEVRVKVKFGGEAMDYAVYIHEMPAAQAAQTHWTIPGTGHKFLEKAVKQFGTQAGVTVYLVPAIKRALEHGAAR